MSCQRETGGDPVAGFSSHGASQLGVADKLVDRCRRRRRVFVRNQSANIVVGDDLGVAADCRGDDRRFTRHRFDDRAIEPFVVGEQHVDVEGGQKRGDVIRGVNEDDVVGNLEAGLQLDELFPFSVRIAADDDGADARMALLENRDRLDKVVNALGTLEAPDRADERRV